MLDFFDNFGESIGGIYDSVVAGGTEYLNAWVDNEKQELATAAPEKQRPKQEPAQQPNGQPIVMQSSPLTTMHYAAFGGVVLLLLLVMFFAMRK